MDPSVNYVISLMGAMSAGGCFVTIDSSFPLKKSLIWLKILNRR